MRHGGSLEWEVPPQQPEGIRWGRIIGAIVGTLLLFGAAVAIVWAMGVRRADHFNPRRLSYPAALSQPEINMLEQVPFPIATLGYSLRDRQLRRLDGWGWVDRERGIIHVPVAVEMARMVAEAEPAGAPRP